MARPWLRRIGWVVIALYSVVATLSFLWVIWWFGRELSLQWDLETVTKVAIAVLALAAVLAFSALIWWLWWRLPERQAVRLKLWDTKARADVEDNFRKTVGQALGGAAVLIGAAIAYLQFTQQQQSSRDLLISNQVSKGFEQLASEKLTERLGGVYALEGVMNTSPEYHKPVLEALCAFVRDRTTREEGTFLTLFKALFVARRGGPADKFSNEPATDVQAALTVIGRRKLGMKDVLSDVNLTGAGISGTDLHDANLSGGILFRTNMSGASLLHANLITAYMGEADLRGADLRGAHLGGRTEGYGITPTQLDHANLSGADLSGADLSYAWLGGANLTRANLFNANLKGSSLEGANLSGANLNSADLSDAHVTQTQLGEACGKPRALPQGLTLDKPCPSK